MQFLSTHNSPAAYNNLVESNIITQQPPGIHQPPSVQATALFGNNFTSKNRVGQFDFSKHLLDNYLDPMHNQQVINATSFMNTRNGNPYTNGNAARYFSYNENVPYSNNYGATDYWNPYINPGKNLDAFLRQQTVKVLDLADQANLQNQNINTFYPHNINPKNDYLKNFNPSDNAIIGKNNFNIQNGNDIPLNVMQPNPTNMPGVITSPMTIPSNDIMNLSLKDMLYNLGKTGLDIINDIIRYTIDGGGDLWKFFHIFNKGDRLGYTGIYIIIITILIMILI